MNNLAYILPIYVVFGFKLQDDEKQAIEEWRRKLTLSLMKSVKQSFFAIISKCLAIGSLDLVGVGLSTLTWLSFSFLSFLHQSFIPQPYQILSVCLRISCKIVCQLNTRFLLQLVCSISAKLQVCLFSFLVVVAAATNLVIQYVLVPYDIVFTRQISVYKFVFLQFDSYNTNPGISLGHFVQFGPLSISL